MSPAKRSPAQKSANKAPAKRSPAKKAPAKSAKRAPAKKAPAVNGAGGAKRLKVTFEPVPGKSPIFFELPFDPKAEWGNGRAPVVVMVGSYTFKTTVGSMFGKKVIGFNREHREAAGVEAGQMATVTVALDVAERTVTPPADFVKALKAAGGWAAWEKLAYSHQKEHVRAIEEAKKAETRERRIAKSVAMIAG